MHIVNIYSLYRVLEICLPLFYHSQPHFIFLKRGKKVVTEMLHCKSQQHSPPEKGMTSHTPDRSWGSAFHTYACQRGRNLAGVVCG